MCIVERISEPLNGDPVKIDLVFVHGLTKVWQDTWNEGETSWIRDFLPKDIPHARTFACGSSVQDDLREAPPFSDALIDGLRDYERRREHEKRPVMFFAHSLGGLVLRNFLQKCTSSLRASTKGIMFFGTPHHGHQEVRNIKSGVTKSDLSQTFNEGLLSQLRSMSDDFPVWLLTQPFAQRVVCIYERLPFTENVAVVEEASAVLPYCDTLGLQANHISMTKFSAETDTNYQIVLQSIKSMYCLADESMRVLLRHSLTSKSHGRLKNLPSTPDACEEFIVSTKGTPEVRNIGRLALVSEDQGHYQKAEEKYQAAVEALTDKGQCSSEVRALGKLALALANHGRNEEIEGKFQRVAILLGKQEIPGWDDVAVLFCLHRWASLMYRRGQYKDAELYGKCCLEARIRISGKGSTPTLLTASNLVLCMMSQGRYQDAYNLLRDALENSDPVFPDNVSEVHMLDAFAKLVLECGYDDLAESLSCNVLRLSICLHGDGHPVTLNRMSDLAAILAQEGHLSAAEALSRRALDGLEQTLGNDHPDCLKTATRLADYIRFQQRCDDASLRHKGILKKQQTRIGEYHPDTLLTMRSLGVDFALQRYWKNAEVVLDQAYEGLKNCLGPQHSDTVWTEKALNHVKEFQKEQTPGNGGLQPDLLKNFGPQQRSVSNHGYFYYACTVSPFQTPIEGEVLQALKDGDEERLRNILVEEKADPQILGRALREAAANSQEVMVKLLLDFNAPVHVRSGYHGNALQAAALAGCLPIVELLLAREADVNQQGGILDNALRAAVQGRHAAILRLLLDSVPTGGLSLDVLNSSLQLALRIEDMAMIDQLLKAGADVNAKDNLFGCPLQQASFYGQGKIMTMLLECRSDVQMRGGICTSPLRAAIETQNESAINQLLEAGATIHSDSTESLLDNSISIREREELAKILLERLADSLPYRPLTNYTASWDSRQISKQTFTYSSDWSGPRTYTKAYPYSDSLPQVPVAWEKAPKATRVSSMKRFKDGLIKSQPLRKTSQKKVKGPLQSFRQKLRIPS